MNRKTLFPYWLTASLFAGMNPAFGANTAPVSLQQTSSSVEVREPDADEAVAFAREFEDKAAKGRVLVVFYDSAQKEAEHGPSPSLTFEQIVDAAKEINGKSSLLIFKIDLAKRPQFRPDHEQNLPLLVLGGPRIIKICENPPSIEDVKAFIGPGPAPSSRPARPGPPQIA